MTTTKIFKSIMERVNTYFQLFGIKHLIFDFLKPGISNYKFLLKGTTVTLIQLGVFEKYDHYDLQSSLRHVRHPEEKNTINTFYESKSYQLYHQRNMTINVTSLCSVSEAFDFSHLKSIRLYYGCII